MTKSNRPIEPSLDAFAIPPLGARTLFHEMASGMDGSYEIVVFEVRGTDSLMWVVRKRHVFTVENNGREMIAPSWTSELHLSQIDLETMARQMLGRVIGKVSGESLQVSATRDQVMMDLRTKLKEHLNIIVTARDNEHLHETICSLQVNADAEMAGGDEDYQCFLSTVRMAAGLIASQLREREAE